MLQVIAATGDGLEKTNSRGSVEVLSNFRDNSERDAADHDINPGPFTACLVRWLGWGFCSNVPRVAGC